MSTPCGHWTDNLEVYCLDDVFKWEISHMPHQPQLDSVTANYKTQPHFLYKELHLYIHYTTYTRSNMSRGFVHRCGRTARMGQTGQAVVMLLPSERPYIEFLELNQHISVQPLPSDSTPDPTLTSRARDLAARER